MTRVLLERMETRDTLVPKDKMVSLARLEMLDPKVLLERLEMMEPM